jgi:hypothetical protein
MRCIGSTDPMQDEPFPMEHTQIVRTLEVREVVGSNGACIQWRQRKGSPAVRVRRPV